MNWNPQQQAMLSAMGYQLLRPVGETPAVAPSAMPAAPSPGRTGSTRAAPTMEKLMQALARAAGGRDPASLPLPPLDQLRASGAAKRALWPVLRALRRQR